MVGAVSVAVLLMYSPYLMRNLPSSALAGIVIASAIGLFEFNDLRRIFEFSAGNFGCRSGAWLASPCWVRSPVLP